MGFSSAGWAEQGPDNQVAVIQKIRRTPTAPSRTGNAMRLRKPAEVLALVGIEPGMTVADLMAGDGWYTEVLARVIGPEGRVYAQNNRISDRNYGARLADRLERSGLDNIVHLTRELEDPGLPEGQLDAVFLVQFYHDTYWMGVDRGAMKPPGPRRPQARRRLPGDRRMPRPPTRAIDTPGACTGSTRSGSVARCSTPDSSWRPNRPSGQPGRHHSAASSIPPSAVAPIASCRVPQAGRGLR